MRGDVCASSGVNCSPEGFRLQGSSSLELIVVRPVLGGRLQTVVNATTAGTVDPLLAMLRREGAESVPFVGVFYTAGFSQKQLRSNTLERLGKGHVGGSYTLRA